MIFHSAKGFEADNIILAGIADEIIPVLTADPAELAEQAGLLYVVITRARHELVISWSRSVTYADAIQNNMRCDPGVEGLEEARADKPDVILLDIMMPNMDGYEVIKELRSDESTKGIPVIFVTARMDAESRERAEALGADGYVTKPYERNSLIEMIRRVAWFRAARGTCPKAACGRASTNGRW